MKKTFNFLPPAFAFIVLLILSCSAIFIAFWHRRGDQFAQAEGALLTFIITGCSVAITLVYIFYTRESLSAAKDAVSVQREQWDQRLRSDPQFWLIEDRKPLDSPIQFPDVAGKVFDFKHQLNFYVWNSGEQSLRVKQIDISLDGGSPFPSSYRPQGFVVRGQYLEKIAQAEMNRAIAQLLIEAGCAYSSSRNARLKIRVHYRTWEREDKVSDWSIFLVRTNFYMQELSVTEE